MTENNPRTVGDLISELKQFHPDSKVQVMTAMDHKYRDPDGCFDIGQLIYDAPRDCLLITFEED